MSTSERIEEEVKSAGSPSGEARPVHPAAVVGLLAALSPFAGHYVTVRYVIVDGFARVGPSPEWIGIVGGGLAVVLGLAGLILGARAGKGRAVRIAVASAVVLLGAYQEMRGLDVVGAPAVEAAETLWPGSWLLCKHGDANACASLGGHARAHGRAARALFFYRRACAADVAGACHQLALLLEHDRRLRAPAGELMEAYGKACMLEVDEACLHLSYGDNPAGPPIVRRACDAGSKTACHYVRPSTPPDPAAPPKPG
jgi:hypothetical protein